MDRVKRFIKESPFLSIGSLFACIGILYEFTVFAFTGEFDINNLFFLLPFLVFYIWFLIYLPIKFFINLKNSMKEKNKAESVFIILLKALIWIIIIGFCVISFLAMKKAGLE